MRKLIFIGTAAYTCCLIYWMFFGFHRNLAVFEEYRYNLVPFRTIGEYFVHFAHYPLRTWIINILGNIGVFAPFGWSLAYLMRWKVSGVLSFMLGALLVLELLQLVSKRGSFDVDDLILNMLGAGLGYAVYAAAKRLRSN